MSLSLGAIVLNVPDRVRSAAFWSQALEYDSDPGNPDFLGPRNGHGSRIHLDETDRTHLDLWVDKSTSTPEAEVERLIALGARRVEGWTYPPDADFIVMEAPDGTTFCIIG